MSYPFIPFEQPAGIFYLSAMPATEVMRIAFSNPRVFDAETLTSKGGVQRELSMRRIRAIADYAEISDATFPTPILLSVSSSNCTLDNGQISIAGDKVAEIVDGQHRVYGLAQAASKNSFTLPVVFVLDATEEEKALLFATINSTQTKVPASIIYELFSVSETRSPQKTCHEIARSLNSMPESPWYRRLKMLGRKSVPGSTESLSQGTFVKFLLPNVSSDPQGDMEALKKKQLPPAHPECVFNAYFREVDDSTILKVLLNTFGAAQNTWPDEWKDPASFVLTKTLGFSGIMRALPDMVKRGQEHEDLSIDYFTQIFRNVRRKMEERNIPLTSEFFSASASGEAEFAKLIRDEIPRQS